MNNVERLTKSELEVLKLMAEGWTNKAIARKLWISDTTMKTHLLSINSKLGLRPNPDLHMRVQAAIAYVTAATAGPIELLPRGEGRRAALAAASAKV